MKKQIIPTAAFAACLALCAAVWPQKQPAEAKETPCWAVCGQRRSTGVWRGRITSLEVASIAFVWSAAKPLPCQTHWAGKALHPNSGQKPGPT